MVDYEYYTDIYKGNIIPSETEFNSVESRASDKLVHFQEVVKNEEALKRCCCAIAEAIYGYNKLYKYGSSQGKINSESVGGYYSVSYGSTSQSGLLALNNDINAIIREYLGAYVVGARKVRY